MNLVEEEEPEPPIDLVTVPGSHNSEMGCAGDWAPGCEVAKLTLRADGIYSGTFDLPAGDYEYKVALNGSWDVNYGANGEQNGPNVGYTHAGGPITFFWNPDTKVVSSTAEGPVVTLPGSFQSEVGCPGDWSPDCLASLMQDGDKDGVYTFATDEIPDGAYEAKVAHGMSWDENYGVGGVPGGANYTFTATEGKLVEFRYTIATHVLEIVVTDPPLAGTGESRAHWVSEDTLAWPVEFLGGASADSATWTLEHSADASLAVAEGEITGGDEPVALELDPAGLSDAQLAKFPALEGYLALHPVGLDRAGAQQLLTEQLAVAQLDGWRAHRVHRRAGAGRARRPLRRRARLDPARRDRDRHGLDDPALGADRAVGGARGLGSRVRPATRRSSPPSSTRPTARGASTAHPSATSTAGRSRSTRRRRVRSRPTRSPTRTPWPSRRTRPGRSS